MPQTQPPAPAITIKGEAFKGINIEGNPYAKVHQRVESAHSNGGYTVESCEFKKVFDVEVCEVWIALPSGQRFPGTAEINRSTPKFLAKAQTRAIGRALAFAGFNIESSIASDEEMEDVMQQRGETVIESEEPRQLPERKAAPQVKAKSLPEPKSKTPTVGEQCAELAKSLGYDHEEFLDLAAQFKIGGKMTAESWEEMKKQLMEEALESQKGALNALITTEQALHDAEAVSA